MALTGPVPTKNKGARNQYPDFWLYRFVPQWAQPEWLASERWRAVVRHQPVAMICRETLIDNILALDWKIEAKDSDQRDELKSEIDYYTNLLTDNGEIEYSSHVEHVLQDMLDLPFGAGTEIGRENNDPQGRVVWFEPLDGATLFPTLNRDFPVGQKVDGFAIDPVFFPAYTFNRIFLSPRTDIRRKGWGMAPPEKIYLSLEMLNRGDQYYANLLLDTPEAGILDLGDMEKSSAEEWVESFRSLLGGIDAFKIPVLYEHTTKTEWIPFGRPPTDLMFDRISDKLAALIAAGYGLTLSDIGLGGASSGGDTLAGSIRSERRTRKTGLAVAKKKITAYFNRFLPPTLKFVLIDYDDELSVALGRARLANATAWGAMIDKRIFSPQEARLQVIADGLTSISLPEEIDESDFDIIQDTMPETPERPGMLGNPVSPSSGGHGEGTAGVGKSNAVVASRLTGALKESFSGVVNNATNARLEKLVRAVAPVIYTQVKAAVTDLQTKSDVQRWNSWYDEVEIDRAVTNVTPQTEPTFEEDEWWRLGLDDDELVILLSLAFQESLEAAAREAMHDLYVNGYLPSPYLDPNMTFKLTNEHILRALSLRAVSLQENVDTGTKYYLRRMIIKSVRDALTEPDVVDKIRSGIDIQEILRDNWITQKILDNIRIELSKTSQYRTDAIVGYELRSAESEARRAQYKRMGLDTKRWEHNGFDIPCSVYCQENEALGFVPLDHEYRSAFGPIFGPLAHPHCHCSLGYNRSELFALAKRGTLYIWTGD